MRTADPADSVGISCGPKAGKRAKGLRDLVRFPSAAHYKPPVLPMVSVADFNEIYLKFVADIGEPSL